jgi:acid phosphatase
MLFTSSLIAVALPNVAAAAYTFDPLQHLAGIAPYFEDPLLDPKAPQGCNVTRASMLVRHAAIYGNDFGPSRALLHQRQLLTIYNRL